MLQSSKSTPSDRLIKLEGYERAFAYSSHGNVKIAHCMLVEGPVQLVVDRAHSALVHVMNQYPRMRALKLRSKQQLAAVQPPVSLQTTAHLIKVLSSRSDDFWQTYAQDVCNTNTDRYTELPYSLHLIKTDGVADRMRLLLFSDHYMSDGMSGLIVLDGILEFIANPQPGPVAEQPLLPSIYSQMLPKTGVSRYFEQAVIKLLKPLASKAFSLRKMETHFTPHPTLNSTKMPENAPSFALFATGQPEATEKSLKRCKEEKVTLHGPIVTAIGLAIAITKRGAKATEIDTFKFAIDCDYNMRDRVRPPRAKTAVGLNIAMSGLMSLREKGMSMTARFWDQSRAAKAETDQFIKMSAAQCFEMRFVNEAYKFMETGNMNLSDVNLSNIGRYPFPLVHSIAGRESATDGDDKLTVRNLHFYNSAIHVCTATVIYLCAVDNCINYGMFHRIDGGEAKQFFQLVVKIIENIGEIGPEESLREVAKRFK
jgi:hypothetical protein